MADGLSKIQYSAVTSGTYLACLNILIYNSTRDKWPYDHIVPAAEHNMGDWASARPRQDARALRPRLMSIDELQKLERFPTA